MWTSSTSRKAQHPPPVTSCSSLFYINYLCTYDLYSPVHNVLDACISITRASGRGFFGPQMALAYRLDAISQGPKNSRIPGPKPLPLAQVMHTANNFGLMCSRKRISQNSFPNLIYIIPKSFMVVCQELHNPKRNYETRFEPCITSRCLATGPSKLIHKYLTKLSM
jgi:hypothetical protein